MPLALLPLTRSQHVFDRPTPHGGGVTFFQVWESLDWGGLLPPKSEVTLSREFWLELGSPSTITVTYEPGDTLNPPKEAA